MFIKSSVSQQFTATHLLFLHLCV